MLSENSWRAFTFDFNNSFVETWFDPVLCVALFIDFFCSTFLFIQNFNYQFLILTVVVLCSAHTSAIKVDFGTRGGPIIPPTPTTYAPPHKPYREPAPVWEESNDIPNPRPFVWVEHSTLYFALFWNIQFWMIQLSFLFSHPRSYELPPPSRSRDNTLNIFDPNYNELSDNPHITSHQPVTPSPVLVNFSNQFGYRLVPVYIPGEGYRYLIAVPSDKWNHLNTNHISDHQQQKYDKYEKYDKYNGRYNAKLKKYKAYEKFLKPQQQLKQQVMQARRV